MAHACVFQRAAATGRRARQLVGYVVSEIRFTAGSRRAACLTQIAAAAAWVPVVLLQISALPLSANGKLDRKALPLPELTSKTSGRAPEDATEIAVSQAFASLLGCAVNDIEADFLCPRPLAAGDAHGCTAQPYVRPQGDAGADNGRLYGQQAECSAGFADKRRAGTASGL